MVLQSCGRVCRRLSLSKALHIREGLSVFSGGAVRLRLGPPPFFKKPHRKMGLFVFYYVRSLTRTGEATMSCLPKKN